jgi:hypothetical protein
LRVVKDIEPFGPELHVNFFRGLENLVDRHAEVGVRRGRSGKGAVS